MVEGVHRRFRRTRRRRVSWSSLSPSGSVGSDEKVPDTVGPPVPNDESPLLPEKENRSDVWEEFEVEESVGYYPVGSSRVPCERQQGDTPPTVPV